MCIRDSRNVVLRFELDFKAETDIPDECLNYFHTNNIEHIGSPYSSICMLEPKTLLAKVKTAYVEVKISWSDDQNRPYVSRYETGLEGEWIARIDAEGYGKKNSVRGFNICLLYTSRCV